VHRGGEPREEAIGNLTRALALAKVAVGEDARRESFLREGAIGVGALHGVELAQRSLGVAVEITLSTTQRLRLGVQREGRIGQRRARRQLPRRNDGGRWGRRQRRRRRGAARA
jgi:hypothetical protein